MSRLATAIGLAACGALVIAPIMAVAQTPDDQMRIPFAPVSAHVDLKEVEDLIGLTRVKTEHQLPGGIALDGSGTTVAVLDTGLHVDHKDFGLRRVPARRSFLSVAGQDENVQDVRGHGTHVTGLIAANGIHTGLASGTRVIPLKVFYDSEAAALAQLGQNYRPTWDRINDALGWVLKYSDEFKITAVNMSLGDAEFYMQEPTSKAPQRQVRETIKLLRAKNIPVIAAAGNGWGTKNSTKIPREDTAKVCEQGMEFPAIVRETISVGAVYTRRSEDGMRHSTFEGVRSNCVARWQIAPFSMRLHETFHGRRTGAGVRLRTDVFAPGGQVYRSTGIDGPETHSAFEDGGTSQAAPIVTGVVLLMQQYHFKLTERYPNVDDIEMWLGEAADRPIWDGDDEYDNVTHTCQMFYRLDAYRTFEQMNLAIAQSQSGQ